MHSSHVQAPPVRKSARSRPSGLLPPFPAPPGSDCPQLQPSCCDSQAVESSHPRSVTSCLAAHRLVHKPPVTRTVPARLGRVDQQRSEPLHPAIHSDVIHLDATFGQQLFHVPVGKAKPQVPTHRQNDDLWRKTEPGERRRRSARGQATNQGHPSKSAAQGHPRRTQQRQFFPSRRKLAGVMSAVALRSGRLICLAERLSGPPNAVPWSSVHLPPGVHADQLCRCRCPVRPKRV